MKKKMCVIGIHRWVYKLGVGEGWGPPGIRFRTQIVVGIRCAMYSWAGHTI